MVDSLALFDLDNTLLDREKAFALWATGFVASNGLDHHARAVIDRADADGIAPRDEFFSELRRELGVATEINELVADYYSEYRPTSPSSRRRLKESDLRSSGFKVAVVTNGPAFAMAHTGGCRYSRRV